MTVPRPHTASPWRTAYEGLIDHLNRKAEAPRQAAESVTLKQNAKGETQAEVTAVAGQDESLQDTADRAAAVYEQLRGTFNGHTEGPFEDEEEA